MATLTAAWFVIALAAYLLVPVSAQQVQRLIMPASPIPDTIQPWLAEQAAARRLAEAESTLAAADDPSILTPGDSADGLAGAIGRRDSLQRSMTALAQLLSRASSAPLPESYRVLAKLPILADDRELPSLLDSLSLVERARSAAGRGAEVDPVFVAFTARLTDIGQRIQAVAERRLRAVVDSLGASGPGDTATSPSPDRVRLSRARDSSAAALEAARAASGRATARARAVSEERQERQGRQAASLPVTILVTAAGIVAVFAGFTTALVDEMRRPRVADASETERVTSLRVLATLKPRRARGVRTRRLADHGLPPWLDPTADDYRIIAWHVASQWPPGGILTVASEVPMVAGIVGANLAAVLANDARATVLIDTVFHEEPVRRVLRLPGLPGLAAVLENKRRWSEALVDVPVGRSRTLEVLPSGQRARVLGANEGEAMVNELRRAARRHDVTVVVATTEATRQHRAGDDVVVCVIRGATRLSVLRRDVTALADAGANVRGVVLWSDARPLVAESTHP